MKIYDFKEINSTNDFAESIKHFGEDAIITALKQSDGHGTKGRSFSSSEGGLYITVLKFYEDFPAARAFEIMINSSLSVCKTLEEFGLKPSIKWPNDVLVNGKKICGILISNTFRGQYIYSSTVGMGINVKNRLPDELKDIATNMFDSGAISDVIKVKEVLIKNLEISYSVEEYKKYLSFLGKEIYLDENGVRKKVKALNADESGRLIVEDNGILRKVSAAEVSLRFN